jgi:hypothetical protein
MSSPLNDLMQRKLTDEERSDLQQLYVMPGWKLLQEVVWPQRELQLMYSLSGTVEDEDAQKGIVKGFQLCRQVAASAGQSVREGPRLQKHAKANRTGRRHAGLIT